MSSSSFFNLSISPKLYRPEEKQAFRLCGKGIYVIHDKKSDTFKSGKGATLSASVDKDAENGTPFVVANSEQDISGRLVSATKAVYTLQIGVAWDTGEATSLFCFDDAIVEYRDNIGKESDKINSVTGTRPCYMGTYASVGIPLARYRWLVTRLAEIGLEVVKGQRDSESNGYYWTNANITKGYRPVAVVRPSGKEAKVMGSSERNLKAALTNIGHNVIGVMGVEITLKRTPDFDISGKRTIAFSLKSFQLLDITDVCSPPLNRAMEFTPSDRVCSARLLDALRGNQKPDGRSVPVAAPSNAKPVAVT